MSAVAPIASSVGRQLQKDVVPKIKQANEMMIRDISAKDIKALDRVLAKIRENARALVDQESV